MNELRDVIDEGNVSNTVAVVIQSPEKIDYDRKCSV